MFCAGVLVEMMAVFGQTAGPVTETPQGIVKLLDVE
jgi:hypothetical protein